MKLVSVRDLQKDKYYMIYENGGYYKVMMICYTTGDLIDTRDVTFGDSQTKFRWAIEGNSYVDYQCIADYDETFNKSGKVSREFKGIDLEIIDPDTYHEGFRLKDNDDENALIYELTDEEANMHLLAHI